MRGRHITEHPSPPVPSQHRTTAAVREATRLINATTGGGPVIQQNQDPNEDSLKWIKPVVAPLLGDRFRLYITVYRMKGCLFSFARSFD
ncbi:uncharacterized protein V6R79_001934 [Siganus canaliculatus]